MQVESCTLLPQFIIVDCVVADLCFVQKYFLGREHCRAYIILQKPGSDDVPPRKLQSFETNLRHSVPLGTDTSMDYV